MAPCRDTVFVICLLFFQRGFMMHKRYVIAAAVAVLLFASAGLPQSTFGSITGIVKDPTGAVIPGTEIEVTNEGTGTSRRIFASSSGAFNVPNLDIGVYRVRITGKGFTTWERSNLQLTANQILDLEAQLAVGATSTAMEVHRSNTMISTESNDISGSVSHQSVEALPLVARQKGDGGA